MEISNADRDETHAWPHALTFDHFPVFPGAFVQGLRASALKVATPRIARYGTNTAHNLVPEAQEPQALSPIPELWEVYGANRSCLRRIRKGFVFD